MPGELDPADNTLKRDGKLILDESDSYGVEMALQLVDTAGGGEVTLVSMAPNGEVSGLRTALAMGAAKAVLVSDPALAGADALATAKVLAAAIKRVGDADLVLAATESTDGYTGTVPEQIAELLGLPSITFAKRVEVDGGTLKVQRQTEAGYDEVACPLPGRRSRDRRRGRAPLPVLQGDHGRQVQAGRRGHGRRPRRRRRSAGPAPARRSSTSPGRPSAQAGEIIEDDGEALPEDRRVPRQPQGHLSRTTKRRDIDDTSSNDLGARAGRRRHADDGHARAAHQGPASSAPTVAAFVGGDAGDIAAALGAHGATKVYATGDLGGTLPGVAGGRGDARRSSTAATRPT